MKEIKIHKNFAQGTIEWHQIREGRYGGGSAILFLNNSIKCEKAIAGHYIFIDTPFSVKNEGKVWILSNNETGIAESFSTKTDATKRVEQSSVAIGDGLKSSIYAKVAERHFFDESDGFQSDAMERGNDLEPEARDMYEDRYFVEVEQVGYISYGEWFGVSPDGLVGDDGMIEIKCPLGKEWIRFSEQREIDKKYVAQMQWTMWLTGRKWCDFIYFHPDGGMIVERVLPDPAMFEAFEQKVPIVEKMLNDVSARIIDNISNIAV